MRQFPSARIKGAYLLSSSRQWHYAERFAIAAVEYCCYSVFRKIGMVKWPLLVFDCSTKTGGTPTNRHPDKSHDGGINLDLGYYGLVDLSSHRYVPGPHKDNRMTGPPDPKLFAAQAEVEWFLAMARLEVNISPAVGKENNFVFCAIDPQIEQYLDPKIQAADTGRTVVAEALRICYSDSDPRHGWDVFHDNHRHVRFKQIQNGDEIADYIERDWILPLLQERPVPQFAIANEDDDIPDEPKYLLSDMDVYEAGEREGEEK